MGNRAPTDRARIHKPSARRRIAVSRSETDPFAVEDTSVPTCGVIDWPVGTVLSVGLPSSTLHPNPARRAREGEDGQRFGAFTAGAGRTAVNRTRPRTTVSLPFRLRSSALPAPALLSASRADPDTFRSPS